MQLDQARRRFGMCNLHQTHSLPGPIHPAHSHLLSVSLLPTQFNLSQKTFAAAEYIFCWKRLQIELIHKMKSITAMYKKSIRE